MGNIGPSCTKWNQRLGWGGVPDTERATYFSERLMCGWYELLCCPSAMGCTVVDFEKGRPDGGEAQYKIKMRLSHSEHVPRYQLHVVSGGKTKQWIVGHMEKTETHLRAKPGEFIRVQVWKLTCNSMVMENRRSAQDRKSQLCMNAVKKRPTPSATNMLMMGMTIATQAKLDQMQPTKDDDTLPDKLPFDRDSERWVQTIGVDNRAYKLTVEPAKTQDKQHKSMKNMNVMRILYRGKKVCIARKQRFAGALGKVEQPYMGVQIKPSEPSEKKSNPATANAGSDADADSDDMEEHDAFRSLLDTHGLMLLLLCLAWSEETMSPNRDMTERFIKAMREKPGDLGSADELGLSVQWDTDDVKQRLKHIPYAQFHNWVDRVGQTDDRQDEADEDGDEVALAPLAIGQALPSNVLSGDPSSASMAAPAQQSLEDGPVHATSGRFAKWDMSPPTPVGSGIGPPGAGVDFDDAHRYRV